MVTPKNVIELKAHLISEMRRFPQLFDRRMAKGLDRLLANSFDHFVEKRSVAHLKRILLTQFFLQNAIEECLVDKRGEPKPIFVRLFRASSSQICIAYVSEYSRRSLRESVFKACQTLIPCVQEVPESFYSWTHPTLPYQYSYFEIRKIRGQEPSHSELKRMKKEFIQQLTSISPLTPALFWPYNKEDSFRQIQLLRKEVKHLHDLPQVSIHFHEQTAASLEFLVYLSRPATSTPLEESLKTLPNCFTFFSEFHRLETAPFPVEIGAFSLKIPSFPFEFCESINLLYARRYVVKQLETLVGTFRDTNGGLFEMQQRHFEQIRTEIGHITPHFELFAEKFFYALHPMETWLNLSQQEIKELFGAFSRLIDDPHKTAVIDLPKSPPKSVKGSLLQSKLKQFAILRKRNEIECLSLVRSIHNAQNAPPYAYFSFGDSYYFCFLGSGIDSLALLESESIQSAQFLRLAFQEGQPPSFNPHFTLGDMRGKILSKLLFEGLTRLDAQGIPQPAGAASWEISADETTYLFKLRPSYWSNGERVTAADYALSWQSALSDSISHPEPLFILKNGRQFRQKKGSLGIECLDDLTLRVELERPSPQFLHQLAQPYFFPLLGSFKEPKWFNGPFLVREKNREGIALEKNAYFWNADLVTLNQIQIEWMMSFASLYERFKKNQIDWIGDPLSTLSLTQITELKQQNKLFVQPVKRRLCLYFNTHHPLLASPLVRQAFKLAVDAEKICQEIFPFATALSTRHEGIKEARHLFQAGLSMLGLSLPELPAITLSYSCHARRKELAEHLQALWTETLGVSVEIAGYEWNEFRNRLEERNFEICATIYDTQAEGTREYYERFEGTSSWNFTGWQNREYRNVLSQEEIEIERLQRLIDSQAPLIPLLDYVHLFGHHSHFTNYRIDNEGCIDFSYSFFR